MKKIVFSFVLLSISFRRYCSGKMERRAFVAAFLKNNPAGEDLWRQLSSICPKDFEGPQRYPVIYVLHGYGGTDMYNDGVWIDFKLCSMKPIKTGKMSPMKS